MKIKERIILLIAICTLTGTAALAQNHRTGYLAVHWGPISPILALIAGILILIFPRILNYVVAIYLIIVGLIGIFGY